MLNGTYLLSRNVATSDAIATSIFVIISKMRKCISSIFVKHQFLIIIVWGESRFGIRRLVVCLSLFSARGDYQVARRHNRHAKHFFYPHFISFVLGTFQLSSNSPFFGWIFFNFKITRRGEEIWHMW